MPVDPMPEEIMREAVAAADEHSRRIEGLYLPCAPDRRAAMIDIVARALMARDSRATEIVRERSGLWPSTIICDALSEAADAILTYDGASDA